MRDLALAPNELLAPTRETHASFLCLRARAAQQIESDATALYRLIQNEYGNERYRGLLRRLEVEFLGINT
jgi:hypothetical protein